LLIYRRRKDHGFSVVFGVLDEPIKNMKKEEKKIMKSTDTSSKKVRPIGDRVLVRPESPEEKKFSFGIIIPDTVSKEKPEQGVVITTGEGKYDENGKLIPMRVKAGDTVLFSKYGYDEVKIDDVEYFIIREDNILAIIK